MDGCYPTDVQPSPPPPLLCLEYFYLPILPTMHQQQQPFGTGSTVYLSVVTKHQCFLNYSTCASSFSTFQSRISLCCQNNNCTSKLWEGGRGVVLCCEVIGEVGGLVRCYVVGGGEGCVWCGVML